VTHPQRGRKDGRNARRQGQLEQSGGDVAPSHIVEAGGGIEDGGQYGDPHRDMRPDFLKEADAGYVPVATLRDGRWE